MRIMSNNSTYSAYFPHNCAFVLHIITARKFCFGGRMLKIGDINKIGAKPLIGVCEALCDIADVSCVIKDKKLDNVYASRFYCQNIDSALNDSIVDGVSSRILIGDFVVYVAYCIDFYLCVVIYQRSKHLEQQLYHDLQEPLRCIANYLQIINFLSDVSSDAMKYVEYSLESVMRLKNWSNSLLGHKVGNFADRSSFYIQDVLEDIKRMIFYKIDERGCCFDIDDLPKICAVRSDIVCIFKNLIENSLLYAKTEDNLVVFIKKDFAKTTQSELVVTYYDNGKTCQVADRKNSDNLGLKLCRELAIANGATFEQKPGFEFEMVFFRDGVNYAK